jgi:hypothetical protein
MATLEEIAKQLKLEIKQKKRDLSLIECDRIISKLKVEDLVTWTNIHPVTNYHYLNVAPKVPYRKSGKNGIKTMTKCLGNVDKLDDRVILAKKKQCISFFKEKWAEMRNDFEILKNNS